MIREIHNHSMYRDFGRQQDDGYWDYQYDGRDRLTRAERFAGASNPLWLYQYAYDAPGGLFQRRVAENGEKRGGSNARE